MSARKIKTPIKKSRRVNKIVSHIELDVLIKNVNQIKEDMDKKLKEVSDICLKREFSAK